MIKIEVRSNDTVRIEGYVNAVGRDSRPIPSPHGKFIEQVDPQTFAKALRKNPNVELRFNHTRVLGSTKTGELTLREDAIGLYAACTVTDSEIAKKARNKELRGWSFGFYVNKDMWEEAYDGMKRRHLQDIDMPEVSILDKTPAYIATSIEQRDDEECMVERRSADDAAEVTVLPDEENPPPKKEDRDLLSRQKQTVEFLKMKGGLYNEK